MNLSTKPESIKPKKEALWAVNIQEMIEAIADFDENRLDGIYKEALLRHPIGEVTRNLLSPLLVTLGLRWDSRESGIAEEHFFAFYLRNILGSHFYSRAHDNSDAPVLLAGLPGELHEIGLLLFALAAHNAGFPVLVLGANMPLNQLAAVASSKECRAIVLSGAIEPSQTTLTVDLPALVKDSPVPVLIGGLGSVNTLDDINRSGAEALGTDIDEGIRRLKALPVVR